ncbi:MAG: hypothetical protein Q9160_007773 [Pyrenula sp. 1 TL-2023]
MSKRKSEEPLESVTLQSSPLSKKVRIESPIDENKPHMRTQQVNGRRRQTNSPNGHDVSPFLEQSDGEMEQSAPQGSEDSEFEADGNAPIAPLRQNAPTEGYNDLYLDTINRTILDFDFEKLCSVSLSNINVYACLVCGKYYQGRGPKSHAYFHALEIGHHVFVNMETKKVYVLPEGYEVKNKSLEDIKYVVDPTFTEEDVKKLDREAKESTDLSNKRYRPGFVGMNNIKANDYLNVIIQTLAHVSPLRNFFLLHPFQQNSPQIPLRSSTLIRKLWNPRAFRSHVSPHELLQEITLRSSKRFTLTTQSDPVDFLSWFLNTLHLSLGGSKSTSKSSSSIIHRTFRGLLRMESQAITARSDTLGDRLRFEESSTISTTLTPYMILTLDLPPVPLFRDPIDPSRNIIPQVPLTNLLQKYSGLQATEKRAHRIRHRLLHPLPPYLMFHVKRFTANKFVNERNHTIVTFPGPRGLDMSPYVEPNPALHPPGEPIYYELRAHVILDTEATSGPRGASSGTGTSGTSAEDTNPADAAANKAVGGEGERLAWKVQVRDKGVAAAQRKGDEGAQKLNEWVEIQDLWVKGTEAETLFTREGYLMVWERVGPGRERGKGNSKGKGRV